MAPAESRFAEMPRRGTPKFLLGVWQQTPPTPGGGSSRAFASRIFFDVTSYFGRVSVFLLLSSVLPAASARQTSAQSVPLQVAADEVAAALARKKIDSAVVFDFSGPGDGITMLGQNLAEEFSAALARAGGSIHVEDRARIREALDRERFSLQLSTDPQLAVILAEDLKVGAFVNGRLQTHGGSLILELACFRTDGKVMKGLRVAWPPSENIRKALAANPVLADSGTGLINYPDPGAKGGYSLPRCLSCPRADYTGLAMKHGTQGMVELLVVIGVDGRVYDIHVKKGLPDGLTMTAVQAAQRWKLKPAVNLNGKPAAVQEIIEMQFRPF